MPHCHCNVDWLTACGNMHQIVGKRLLDVFGKNAAGSASNIAAGDRGLASTAFPCRMKW